MNRRFLILVLAVAVLGAGVLGVVFYGRAWADRQFATQAALARQDAERIRAEVVLYFERKISAGNFTEALRGMGLDPLTSAAIVSSAQLVYDFRHVQIGRAHV